MVIFKQEKLRVAKQYIRVVVLELQGMLTDPAAMVEQHSSWI
jgi:hypothetical protein